MVERLGNRPALRVLIGRAYRETGFLPESIEEFKKAIELDPSFPRVHYYLGLTYLYKDGAARIPDAIEEFKIELAANPEEYFANFYLGILYIMERKFEPAIALLEKAVSKQPNNPDPYFHLGQAYQGAGRHAECGRSVAENYRAQSRARAQRLPGDDSALPPRPVVVESRSH